MLLNTYCELNNGVDVHYHSCFQALEAIKDVAPRIGATIIRNSQQEIRRSPVGQAGMILETSRPTDT